MDDVHVDIDSAPFIQKYGGLTGQGVGVAVLDSGIDISHPYLRVSNSISTCGETIDFPGEHGTHCAGVIASRDARFPGIAPEVTLLNIKVARSNGLAFESYISLGVDQAALMGAQILSLSVGLNQLPRWSDRGNGGFCPNADCIICRAVNNVVLSNKMIVIAAAGNNHRRADLLRRAGHGNQFLTELCCPGQATHALTVGAISKGRYELADFSSRGPNVRGDSKPDLVAPGINITSTVPVPRIAPGVLMPNPPRSLLFDRKSGTSIAAPVIAGAAALIMEREMKQSNQWTSSGIRQSLSSATVLLPFVSNSSGSGRLALSSL